jgi:hypothetical protein
MTEISTPQCVGGVVGRLAGRIAQLQRQLSNRIHADGDAFAREHGWSIAATAGRLGFGGRLYRDPRFSQHVAAKDSGQSASRPGSADGYHTTQPMQTESRPKLGVENVRIDPRARWLTNSPGASRARDKLES